MAENITAIDLGEVVGPQGQTGQTGQTGQNGTNFLSGAGAPESSVGSDGDTYLDVTGLGIYYKLAGSWMLVSQPWATETYDCDYGDTLHSETPYYNLRHNTEYDTRNFLYPCMWDGSAGSTKRDSQRVYAIRRGGVVTFHFDHPYDSDRTDAVNWESRYEYGTVSADTDTPDHKNFGVILPEGWRPANTVRAPCDAWGMTVTGSNAWSSQRYHGIAQVQPNGAVAVTRLHNVSTGAAATPTLWLTGLSFSATYVLP